MIISVESDEAQAMTDLIEMLFDEWYVLRSNRKAKLASIERMALGKQLLLEGGSATK